MNDFADSKQVKKSKMDKESIKDLLFGSIQELSRNRKYYYQSSIGIDYSYWTDDGVTAIKDFLNIIAIKMREAENEELDRRAKDLVVKGLKGEYKTDV